MVHPAASTVAPAAATVAMIACIVVTATTGDILTAAAMRQIADARRCPRHRSSRESAATLSKRWN